MINIFPRAHRYPKYSFIRSTYLELGTDTDPRHLESNEIAQVRFC